MPEGHTLHRLARLHQQRFGRAPVTVSSPQGRFADGAAAIDGRVLSKADAWGKHLFHHYAGGAVVHVHLGPWQPVATASFVLSSRPSWRNVGRQTFFALRADGSDRIRNTTRGERKIARK